MILPDFRFTHEVKRRDSEIERLKEKLLKLLGDKGHLQVGGTGFLEVTPCLLAKPAQLRRGQWQTEANLERREGKREDGLQFL